MGLVGKALSWVEWSRRRAAKKICIIKRLSLCWELWLGMIGGEKILYWICPEAAAKAQNSFAKVVFGHKVEYCARWKELQLMC